MANRQKQRFVKTIGASTGLRSKHERARGLRGSRRENPTGNQKKNQSAADSESRRQQSDHSKEGRSEITKKANQGIKPGKRMSRKCGQDGPPGRAIRGLSPNSLGATHNDGGHMLIDSVTSERGGGIPGGMYFKKKGKGEKLEIFRSATRG